MARKGARSVSAPANKLVYETAGIVCLTLGAILLVALSSGSSGAVTALLVRGLRCGFGVGAYAVPLGVMLAGILLIVRYEEALRVRPAGAGLPVLCAVILTFAHLPADPAVRFDEEVLVSGGGVVGATLAALLSLCFGPTGAYIIAAGGALAAVAIASPKPLAVLLGPAALAAQRLWARVRALWAQKAEERRRMRIARKAKTEPKTRRVKAPRPPKPAVLDEPIAQSPPPSPAPPTPAPEPAVAAAPAEPPIPAWLIPPREGPVFPGSPAPAKQPSSPVDWSDEQGTLDLPLRETRPPRPRKPYELPTVGLLDDTPPFDQERHAKEAAETIRLLEEALADYSIGARVVSIERGPSVTRYEVQPDKGVRGASVTKLADDLARALAAIDVRVESHVPGKSVIGIEVPNRTVAIVSLKEIMESQEMQASKSPLSFALGRDISGCCIVGDLARMPHLLVAGATNSGKSVCLNGLILSILMRTKPDEVKFMMIDPKRVELALYDNIPHLISPVVYDAKEAAGLLRQAIAEMEERYRLLASAGVRNIGEFNKRAERLGEDKLFYLVIVVDELADLMMQAAAEFEYSICRIAQLARAVGIHLIVATQRPSVNVVTGLIKANIPSRVAFAVSSQTDSRVILDCVGAERLIGRGDMLYSPIDASKPRRIQGAYTSVEEINRVVDHLQKQGDPEFLIEPIPLDEDDPSGGASVVGGDAPDSDEELLSNIVDFVRMQKQVSTSMLQRKFRIGYNRAARIVDILEERGVVGPADGAKPRVVLPRLAGVASAAGEVPPAVDQNGYEE